MHVHSHKHMQTSTRTNTYTLAHLLTRIRTTIHTHQVHLHLCQPRNGPSTNRSPYAFNPLSFNHDTIMHCAVRTRSHNVRILSFDWLSYSVLPFHWLWYRILLFDLLPCGDLPFDWPSSHILIFNWLSYRSRTYLYCMHWCTCITFNQTQSLPAGLHSISQLDSLSDLPSLKLALH